jgi:hypothetical protein
MVDGEEATMMAHVRLRIEELVLEGFPAGDRYRIAAAVEAELARLFAEQGIPVGLSAGGAMSVVDGGSFDLTPGARPERIGAQVAQAVYGGLAK